MKIEEFYEYVKENILSYLPKEYQEYMVELDKKHSINQTVVYGIILKPVGSRIAPVLRLDGVYEQYKNSSIQEVERCMPIIAANFLQVIRQDNFDCLEEDIIKQINSMEYIKDNICFRLINAEMNKEFLKNRPHRMIAGLAVIYYIHLEDKDDKLSSIDITYDYLNNRFSELGEEQLFSFAKKNTPILCPVKISDLDSLVMSMIVKGQWQHDVEEVLEVWQASSSKMLVLTNSNGVYGATTMLYPGVLEILKQELGEFVILPSSVDEVLIVRMQPKQKISGLKDMIEEINANTELVPKKKLLSNEIFTITPDGSSFEILPIEGD